MKTLEPGVWAVVPTPFDDDLQVDVASLEKLVSFYDGLGVTGLTVLGVFGEAAALSRPERDLVLRTVSRTSARPLVIGLTATHTAPAIEEAAATLAVLTPAALMVQVNSPSPDAGATHFGAVAAHTGLPVVVQDYPVASGVSIGTGPLAELVGRLGPQVAAIKAEAPPTPPAVADLAGLGVPVFGGLGGIGLLDELAAGSAGAMTGFSCPEGLLACVRAFRSGGYDAARQAWTPYLPLVNFEQQAKIALAIRKECFRERGLIATARVRPPAAAFPESLRPQLRRHLAAVPEPALTLEG